MLTESLIIALFIAQMRLNYIIRRKAGEEKMRTITDEVNKDDEDEKLVSSAAPSPPAHNTR